MARSKVSFTELAHQVVHESAEPLTVLEILERVNAITPITTKNPKNTIRNAVSQSWLIVPTGDGRYGREYIRRLWAGAGRHPPNIQTTTKKLERWNGIPTPTSTEPGGLRAGAVNRPEGSSQ